MIYEFHSKLYDIGISNDGIKVVRRSTNPQLAVDTYFRYIEIDYVSCLLGLLSFTFADKSKAQLDIFLEKEDSRTFKREAVVAFIKSKMKEAKDRGEVFKPTEYRIRCNTCGNVYCYTSEDVYNNELQKKIAQNADRMARMETVFSSQLLGSVDAQKAEREKSKIVDFSRCPKCNSTDVKEIPEGEPIPTAETPAASAMDELKKLKELLDMGIVTQEEFDAKKKQLLGL